MSNQQVADATGVHIKTVSHWRNDHQVPTDANIEVIAPLLSTSAKWLRYGDTPVEVRDGRVSTERPQPRVLSNRRVRVWLAEFQLELTKLGVDDDSIRAAMDLLTNPAVFTYYAGGSRGVEEFNEEQSLQAMEAIADFIRYDIKKRGPRLPSAE